MKNKLLNFLICVLMFMSAHLVQANGVVISNTALVNQNTNADTWQVRFNLAWNNSWKDNINFDAVWIFCKYKVGSGNWMHASINASGFSTGSGTPILINVACDQKGAFVSCSNQGQGTVSVNNMELQWNYGLDGVHDTNTVSFNIYGIEMVYVPSGPFTIGDGNGVNSSSNHSFFAVSDHLPYTIDNLMSPNISGRGSFVNPSSNPPNFIRIDGDAGLDLDLDGIVDSANYPTGYNAFYMMKYEITQGQYTDFLNVLNYVQQTNRVQNATNIQGQNAFNAQVGPVNRYTIIVQNPGTSPSIPRQYSTARPDRGCPNIAMTDLLAYLDWAALRPMTELEYEKACRGPLPPLVNERVTGTTNGWNENPTLSGTENGAEFAVSFPQNGLLGYNQTISQGDGGNGPVRVGLLATSFSSRSSAGKSYYGIDNLGDHLLEWMVNIGNVAGRSFMGNHGDGLLHVNGHANEGTWPGSNGNTNLTLVNPFINTNGCNNINSTAGRAIRTDFEISNRNWNDNASSSRAGWSTNANGGRGVRTAFTSEFGFSTSSGNYLTINTPANFEASAFNGANYAWSFPSGNPASSTLNPVSTTWSSAGTYNVSLQTIANQCTSSTIMPLTVYTVCMPPSNQSWTQDNSNYRRNSNCGYTPMRTLDGLTDGNSNCNVSYMDCNAVSTGNPGYLVYDMGSSQTVSKFKLYSTHNCCCCCGPGVGDFTLKTGSSLTGPWTTVVTATGSGADAWQEFNFANTSARYWRIEVTSYAPNSNNWTSGYYIQEVAFEGCN